MEENEANIFKKPDVSKVLEYIYQLYESSPMDSVSWRCLGVWLYFSQMTSYIFYFSLDEIKDDLTKHFCYFNYYLNFVNLIHVIKSAKFTILIFFLFFTTDLLIISNMVNYSFISKLRGIKKDSKKMNIVEQIANILSNFFLWHIMIFSIEFFLIGFQKNGEIDYLLNNITQNELNLLRIVGIIGIIFSISIGIIVFYFNQDYKYLDKTKIRMKLNIKSVVCCLILRIFQTILFHIVRDVEWLFFAINYFFLFINLFFYLTNLPFKNRTISIFFIFSLCYSISNLIIFNLFRVNFLINESDILPLNLIFLLFCKKLGEKIYYSFYYGFLFYEDKTKKIPLFLLEELTDLYMSPNKKEEENFILFGYFLFHQKYCSNKQCSNLRLKMSDCSESNKKNLMDFIYKNFKELTDLKSSRNKDKNDEESIEILCAKFVSFLMFYGINPILNFYEIQKTLLTKKNFSIYFKIFSASLNNHIKKQLKMYFQKKELDFNNLKRKKTYEEFFNSIDVKKKIEIKFKSLATTKINFFEKTLSGFLNYKELFVFNLKLSHMIMQFKQHIKNLNQGAPYMKILKFKFSLLLNCLILNKIANANLNEKRLQEFFRSKTEDIIDKSFIADFFKEDTVACEASFIGHRGCILEKSKNSKFMKFFGYSHEEMHKIYCVDDLMPEFIRNTHEQYIIDYINQKRTTQKTELHTFAVDREEFVFPILLSVSLKYSQRDDFILYGAFTKISDYNTKFCICNLDGNILNISHDLFQDFKKEYDFLRVDDVKFINILQLIPDFYSSLDFSCPISPFKESSHKMYFPKEMKMILDFMKTKQKEEVTSRGNKRSITTTTLKFIWKDIKTFKNINGERKYAEITFNLIPENYGYEKSTISFLVFSIVKYKKIEIGEESENSENINNTTVIPKDILKDQKDFHPQVINLFAYEEERQDHFGAKLNIKHQSLKKDHAKSKI